MNNEIIRQPHRTVAEAATVRDASPFDAIMEIDHDGTGFGSKRCPRCGERKALLAFHANKGRPDGTAFYCKQCQAEYNRKTLYGITREQHADLMSKQGGRCAVCKVSEAQRQLAFAVDHDHRCCPGERSCGRCLRGLLCDACNRAIGFMKDSPENLRSAAAYLEVFRASPQNPSELQKLPGTELLAVRS